ncbi:MAG: hypothetical protein ACKOE2_09015, partial [Actinomycetales bacterium]
MPRGVDTWLVGACATTGERVLIYAGAVVSAGLVWVLSVQGQGWSWWLSLLAVLIAADLFGGAIANATSSTKAQYQAPLLQGAPWWQRLIQQPVVFTALHVYPLLIVLLYPGGSWSWGIGWYAAAIGAVALVDRGVRRNLQRPTAMAMFVIAIPVAVAFPGPPGWSWLPMVYLAKLLLGHAVHE